MSRKELNIAESITPTETPNVSMGIKEAAKKRLMEFIQEEGHKLVRGIFQCFETPGATVKIEVKKYPPAMGVPPFSKNMTDGETYEIPLYVARHLNGYDATAGALGDKDKRNPNIGTCSYPIHGFKWDQSKPLPASQLGTGPKGEGGIPVPIVGIVKRTKRYGFQSLEFAGDMT